MTIREDMAPFTRRGKEFFPILALSLFFCLIYAVGMNIFSQGARFFYDQVHDFFIPLNAAYAMQKGYALHQDFHTPFGWIYAVINYGVLVLIEAFPSLLSLNGWLSIASLLFAIGLIPLCAILYYTTPAQYRPVLFLIILLALSMVFQLRMREDIKIIYPAPVVVRGSYNNHLWALMLLQAFHMLMCMRKYADKTMGRSELLMAAVFQALCLTIAFHYKASFFVGAGLIAVSFITLISLKEALIYSAAGAAVFGLPVLAAMGLGYSYPEYFNDLFATYQAKKTSSSLLDIWQVFGALGGALALAIYENLYVYRASSGAFFKTLLKQSRFLFAFFLIFYAFFIVAKGDYDQPYIYPIMVGLIFILLYPPPKYKSIISICINCIFITLICLNVVSLIISVGIENTAEEGVMFTDFDISSLDARHRIHFKLASGNQEVPREEWTALPQQQKHDALISHSYRWMTGEPLSYMYERDLNGMYAHMLSEALKVSKDIHIQPHEKPLLVEFINPLPFLTHSTMPAGSPHWIHLGVTFSIDSLTKLHPVFVDSDMVVVPAKAIDWNIQQLLNCTFYEWNLAQGEPFKVFKITDNAIYLGRDAFMKKRGLSHIYRFDNLRNTLPKTCAEVRKGLMDLFTLNP